MTEILKIMLKKTTKTQGKERGRKEQRKTTETRKQLPKWQYVHTYR